MHELGIVKHVLEQVERAAEENGAEKVLSLTLEVGEVSSIVPEYFTDCFEWAKKKTEKLKECELNLVILEGISYCQKCKRTYKTVEHGRRCPFCGSGETYLITGNEMNIKDMTVT